MVKLYTSATYKLNNGNYINYTRSSKNIKNSTLLLNSTLFLNSTLILHWNHYICGKKDSLKRSVRHKKLLYLHLDLRSYWTGPLQCI